MTTKLKDTLLKKVGDLSASVRKHKGDKGDKGDKESPIKTQNTSAPPSPQLQTHPITPTNDIKSNTGTATPSPPLQTRNRNPSIQNLTVASDSPDKSSTPSPLHDSLFENNNTHDSNDGSSSVTKTCRFVSGARLKISNDVTARSDHTAVLFDDSMYVFGGITAAAAASDHPIPNNDLLVLNFSTRSFVALAPTPEALLQPPARALHTAVLHEGLGMVIFGGRGGSAPYLNDIYAFSFETGTWTQIVASNPIMGRRGHCSGVHKGHMYVFGGQALPNGDACNEFHKFDFETKTWSLVSSPSGPSARYRVTACVYNNYFWVFGGTDGKETFSDLFKYDFDNNTWTAITLESPPGPRYGHVASCLNASIYFIGGSAGSGTREGIDAYELNFERYNSAELQPRKWFRVIPTVPGVVRHGHTAVVRGESIYLFGGAQETTASVDYFCLGKDDLEEDILQEVAQDDEISRLQALPISEWEATILRKHPDILAFRETTRDLTGVQSCAQLSGRAASTEDPTHLSSKIVLQFCMEYLESFGYARTAHAIMQESGVPFASQAFGGTEPRLVTLLKLLKPSLNKAAQQGGGPNPRSIFDAQLLAEKTALYGDENDPEVEALDHLPERLQPVIEGEEDIIVMDKKFRDVDIWDELPDTRNNIKTKEENGKQILKAANLNKLVLFITSEKERHLDLNNLKTFFYTYQSFTTPETLLKKFIQKYRIPSSKNMDEKTKHDVQARVVLIIKFWIDKCAWDFTGPNSEQLVVHLVAFIDSAIAKDQDIKQLRTALSKVNKKKYFADDSKIAPPEPKVPKNIFSSSLTLKDIDELEISRQLTIIEFDLFKNITPPEFLSGAWKDLSNNKRAPHIKELQLRALDVSRWVAHTILSQPKKYLTKMLEKFIKIADCLRAIKNFQTLFAVVAGLLNKSVSRLSLAFNDLPPRSREIYQELENVVSPLYMYRGHQNLLQSEARPAIPCIDAILHEVQTIEDNHASMLNTLINYEKRSLIANVIIKVQSYQTVPYQLQPVYQIATFISKFTRISDEELQELSSAHQP